VKQNCKGIPFLITLSMSIHNKTTKYQYGIRKVVFWEETAMPVFLPKYMLRPARTIN
jgi:hypothetical protein